MRLPIARRMGTCPEAWAPRLWRLAVALLGACSGLPLAYAQTAAAPSPGEPAPPAWTCQYVVTPDDFWLARCYELAQLITYDPIDDRGRRIVWDVPLWGPPLSDDRTRELVRAVLCGPTKVCAVRVSPPLTIGATRRG